jgi:hypothetical protein
MKRALERATGRRKTLLDGSDSKTKSRKKAKLGGAVPPVLKKGKGLHDSSDDKGNSSMKAKLEA